jgi:hypothetical protein
MAVTPRQSAWLFKNGKWLKVKPGTPGSQPKRPKEGAPNPAPSPTPKEGEKKPKEKIDPNDKLKKAQEEAERKRKRQKTIENIGKLGEQLSGLSSGTPSSKSKVPKSPTVEEEEENVKSTVKKVTQPKVIPTQQQTNTNTELQISASKSNQKETKKETKTEEDEEEKKRGGRRRSKRRRQ